LQYFACTGADGSREVRFTPEGAKPFVKQDVAKVGDYLATFPRRLGAPALFPLTPVNYHLWGAPNIFGVTCGAPVPGGKIKAGDTWDYRFLFSCFTSQTGDLNQTPERIRLMYGLAGKPGYSLAVAQGELLGTVYELRLKSADGVAVVKLGQADLPGSLPIVVEGLNERWTAVIADGASAPRFIGVFEGRGYTVTDLRDGAKTVFVGHPVTCGDPRVLLNLVDWSPDRASVEVHNPTERPISTWVATSPACGFLPAAKAEAKLEPGSSQVVPFGR
jgi:hypothetical protein